MELPIVLRLNRRDLLKWGGAAILGGVADLSPRAAFGQTASCYPPKLRTGFEPCSGSMPVEVYPTSPLIGGYVDSNGVVRGAAFTEELIVPQPLRPVTALTSPAPSKWQQDSRGNVRHQFFTGDRLPDGTLVKEPVLYDVRLKVGEHRFSCLKALPIDALGNPVVPPKPQVQTAEPRYLPSSVIYGFNGTFPGPMIKARYGQPVLVRFTNELGPNRREDFGDPNFRFLTHLHNAHTAPESDGNPHHFEEGYSPCEWVDNMYLNWPAGGDDREMQSFLWFHDHKEQYTGANVYKGLVGLYPIYDPVLDPGDERYGLRLPGVPASDDPYAPVDYDIPLVLFDCVLDDGVTPHKDFHNGCGETHPEFWGETFFRHYPDEGFVGDVFTVNGTAYPMLEVKRRKYRLRFLDASIARLYKLMLMWSSDSPQATPGRAGQYQLPNAEQCMRFTQIASEGGLLPYPIDRDSLTLSPAKRREVIVDFSRWIDGWPTKKGDCLYLVNVMKMINGGRKEDDSELDPNYVVPILKIVIGDDAPDNSQIRATLRELPEFDPRDLRRTRFKLERGGGGGGSKENEWLVNGLVFDAHHPMALCKKGRPEVWVIENGGGGWTHPMHFHQEEHRVLSRNGVKTVPPPRPTIDSYGRVRPALVNARHADDWSKEDTIAHDPNDVVVIYRNFRTFEGPYVAHCHNLAHEDHNMMFGWSILV
jgi:FtsP/CotA-like multicopper oxidase with cupredoxin domain